VTASIIGLSADGGDQRPAKGVADCLSPVVPVYAELYNFKGVVRSARDVRRAVQALGSTSLVLAVLQFPSLISRGVRLVMASICDRGRGGWRIVFEWLTTRSDSEGLLLVGTGAATVSLARELCARLGVHIVGFIDPIGACWRAGAQSGSDWNTRRHPANHLLHARIGCQPGRRTGTAVMDKLLEMKLDGVTFDHLASVYEECTGKIAVENLRPSWLIFSEGFRKSPLLQFSKRAIDIVAASIGLMLAAPLMMVIAIAVKLTSPGDILYRQQRVGKNGRVFTLRKFRSMCQDAERSGARLGGVTTTA
jgi:hypothetical protein